MRRHRGCSRVCRYCKRDGGWCFYSGEAGHSGEKSYCATLPLAYITLTTAHTYYYNMYMLYIYHNNSVSSCCPACCCCAGYHFHFYHTSTPTILVAISALILYSVFIAGYQDQLHVYVWLVPTNGEVTKCVDKSCQWQEPILSRMGSRQWLFTPHKVLTWLFFLTSLNFKLKMWWYFYM